MIRKITALFSINALLFVSLLVRNVLIARLVGVENFGIAATFALVVAAMEATSALSGDRFIVQDRDGGSSVALGVIHTLNVVRSVLVAGLMYACAPLIAMLFRMPDLTWTYQVLALVPLLRAFQNFDVFQQHRSSVFWKSSWMELVGVVVGTLAIFPALAWFNDYRLMLLSLLAQYLTQSVASHLLSATRFRLAFDREIAGRWFRFGLPITVNNMLIFALMNGDRLVIAAFIGISQLGWFSAAQALTMAPALVLLRTLGSVLLASLSRKQDDPAEFNRLAGLYGKLFVAIALLVGLGLYLFGGPVFLLLFGRSFEGALPIFSLLVAIACLRLARGSFVVVSLARGQSKNDLVANLPRLAALPLVALAAWAGWTLPHILLIAVAAEAIGLALSGWLLQQTLGARPAAVWPLRLLGVAFLALLVADSLLYSMLVQHPWLKAAEAGALGAFTLATLWLCRDLRKLGKSN